MRIIPFDPYGAMPPQQTQKDPHSHTSLNRRISDEIAKNEAMRLALLAIADQEKDERQRKHRYKILNRKQAKVLLSQLRNVDLDFQNLKNRVSREEEESDEEGREEDSRKEPIFEVSKNKKPIKIGASAAQAIANAAEAWVIARNRGVLDMASLLFWHKDDEC